MYAYDTTLLFRSASLRYLSIFQIKKKHRSCQNQTWLFHRQLIFLVSKPIHAFSTFCPIRLLINKFTKKVLLRMYCTLQHHRPTSVTAWSIKEIENSIFASGLKMDYNIYADKFWVSQIILMYKL